MFSSGVTQCFLSNEKWDWLSTFWFPLTSELIEINGGYCVDWDWAWLSKGNKFVSKE